MAMQDEIFSRSQLLLGPEVMEGLAQRRVIVFGVGGVGSWCVEALVRTGLKHITIVDNDSVSPSNINRQLMATTATVGQVKVDALKRHLLTINPDAEVVALQKVFCADTVAEFALESYDYIIDCIDSLSDKMLLIETATACPGRFFSSMGAALKLDPRRVAVAEFRKVTGCPLARALRQRFKRAGRYPRRKFLCVYSDELLPNRGVGNSAPASVWDARKAQINGSLMHITATFGLTLAGLVIEDLYKAYKE